MQCLPSIPLSPRLCCLLRSLRHAYVPAVHCAATLLIHTLQITLLLAGRYHIRKVSELVCLRTQHGACGARPMSSSHLPTLSVPSSLFVGGCSSISCGSSTGRKSSWCPRVRVLVCSQDSEGISFWWHNPIHCDRIKCTSPRSLSRAGMASSSTGCLSQHCAIAQHVARRRR